MCPITMGGGLMRLCALRLFYADDYLGFEVNVADGNPHAVIVKLAPLAQVSNTEDCLSLGFDAEVPFLVFSNDVNVFLPVGEPPVLQISFCLGWRFLNLAHSRFVFY